MELLASAAGNTMVNVPAEAVLSEPKSNTTTDGLVYAPLLGVVL